MPPLTMEYRDHAHRLAREQAVAYVTDLHHLALPAPDDAVLAACESAALDQGRTLLRATLAALANRVAAAEQKGGSPAAAALRTPDAPKACTRGPS